MPDMQSALTGYGLLNVGMRALEALLLPDNACARKSMSSRLCNVAVSTVQPHFPLHSCLI